MAEQTKRPVLEAIAKVMETVGSVEKRGKNKFHNYDYATAADIMHALQKRMSEVGLVITASQRDMRLMANDSICAIDFEFGVEHVSGDKLEDKPMFTGMASFKTKNGFDDKVANKCLVAAMKYFMLTLFKIPTGDYHDADADEAPSNANGQSAKPPSNRERAPQPPADDSTPFDDHQAPPDSVPFKRSDGRTINIKPASAIDKLWDAHEADGLSDKAFMDLLEGNREWMQASGFGQVYQNMCGKPRKIAA